MHDYDRRKVAAGGLDLDKAINVAMPRWISLVGVYARRHGLTFASVRNIRQNNHEELAGFRFNVENSAGDLVIVIDLIIGSESERAPGYRRLTVRAGAADALDFKPRTRWMPQPIKSDAMYWTNGVDVSWLADAGRTAIESALKLL